MERLRKLAKQWDISLSDLQLRQFQTYYDMLVETNKVMNLTTVTDLSEVITRHFLDSIALSQIVPEIRDHNYHLLDLGTGAGFPGLPLKIVFPDLSVTLMDSLNKRIHFLERVVIELGLSDISCVHGRAEESARQEAYRQKYDLCVSRAVANLSVLCEYCLPFVKTGGFMIAYKSAEIEEEAAQAEKAIHLLGGRLKTIRKLEIPDTGIVRSFVWIEKVKSTPKTYPRKAGTAKKDPL